MRLGRWLLRGDHLALGATDVRCSRGILGQLELLRSRLLLLVLGQLLLLLGLRLMLSMLRPPLPLLDGLLLLYLLLG